MDGTGILAARPHHRKVSCYTSRSSSTNACTSMANCFAVMLTDSLNSNMDFSLKSRLLARQQPSFNGCWLEGTGWSFGTLPLALKRWACKTHRDPCPAPWPRLALCRSGNVPQGRVPILVVCAVG